MPMCPKSSNPLMLFRGVEQTTAELRGLMDFALWPAKNWLVSRNEKEASSTQYEVPSDHDVFGRNAAKNSHFRLLARKAATVFNAAAFRERERS